MRYVWKVYARLLTTSFKEYSRDLLPLLFSLALPLFFIISLGSAGNAASPSELFSFKALVIGDEPVSNAAYTALAGQSLFTVTRANEGDAEEIIHAGGIQAVIRPTALLSSPLEIYTTETFRNVVPMIQQLVSMPVTGKAAVDTEIIHKIVTEPKYNYFIFVFPSIIALSLLQVSLFGTAAPIVSAKEKGIYRYYAVVPMPRLALLVAQVSVRFVIAFAQIALLLAVGCIVYKIRIESPFQLFPILVLGSVVLIAYGYAIAGLFSSISLATGFLLFLNFYCMMFGQLFVDMSESYWQWLVVTTPVGFVSDALRQSVTGRNGMFPLSVDIAGMFTYLVLSAIVAIKYFSFQPKVK